MTLVELLTAEDAILLGGRKEPSMLMLEPSFPMPQPWRHSVHDLVSVLIVRPDGQQVSATAHLGLSYPHLYTRNPDVSSDKQLRVTVCFSDLAKEDVPAGSKILISKEVRDAILQSHAA